MRTAPLWVLLLVAGSCAGPEPAPAPRYVGMAACARCHLEETALWRGSHHDLAMQEAREDSVLGSFDDTQFTQDGSSMRFFRRDGKFLVESDGKEYEVAYTFGVEPLQQYLLRFPGGRLQALTVAWDTRPRAQGGERWFDLYPDERIAPGDPLHWTGRLQNWNLMCAECHSTNLTKNYHFETDAYGTTWSEPNVSCEACHGPGSQHVRWGEEPEGRRTAENGLVLDLSDRDAAVWSMDLATGLSKRDPARRDRTEIETCGRCHSRRSAEGADYRHGRPLLDTHRVSFLEDTLYYSDGQMLDEVYNYGSFLQSKMYASGVTCKDCHEPHGLQVRGEGSSVCLACHASATFDTPAHHFHEPGTAGASCVECHMPATTYMVVDPRHDHSFRVPRPDLSTSLGVPNACNRCHRDRSSQWASSAIENWYGKTRRPHFGEALDAGRRQLPGADSRLAALAQDRGAPGIVRGTALELLRGSRSPDAIAAIATGAREADPFVRLGALEGSALFDPGARHRLAVPLLSDPVRQVRMEAARLLSEVPKEYFTPDQRPTLDRALEEYRQAQLRNADWPESHMNLALVHLAGGELAEAGKEYESALRIDPSFTSAYVNLADLRRMEGRDADAEALLRRALDRAPEAADIHHALGLALVRLKQYEAALPHLRRATELSPDDARYAYVYGVALEGAGDSDAAIRTLMRAAEVHPGAGEILFAIASFEEKRGRISSAAEYARRLLEASPGDPGARELLERLESRR